MVWIAGFVIVVLWLALDRGRPAGACRTCGAPIEWRNTLDERGVRNGRIPLDVHEVVVGPNRFTVNENGEAIPVAERKQVLAQTDHRETCGQAAGGRR